MASLRRSIVGLNERLENDFPGIFQMVLFKLTEDHLK